MRTFTPPFLFRKSTMDAQYLSRCVLIAFVFLFSALLLVGCDGGTTSVGATQSPKPVDLSMVDTSGLDSWLIDNSDSLFTLAAGDSQDVEGVRFTCADGGPSCRIVISRVGQANTMVTSAGGIASATPVPRVVDLEDIDQSGLGSWLDDNSGGVITVQAGGSEDIGGVRFSCPDSGPNCRVTVSQNQSGTIAVTSAGGIASATPIPRVVDLEGIDQSGLGSWLDDNSGGVITVQAGGSEDIGGVRFSCPDSGPNCRVTVSQNQSGTIAVTSTGGSVIAEQSQSGPPPPTTVEFSKLFAGMNQKSTTTVPEFQDGNPSLNFDRNNDGQLNPGRGDANTETFSQMPSVSSFDSSWTLHRYTKTRKVAAETFTDDLYIYGYYSSLFREKHASIVTLRRNIFVVDQDDFGALVIGYPQGRPEGTGRRFFDTPSFQEHSPTLGTLVQIRGTLDGAIGSFSCEPELSKPCTSRTNSGVIELSGGWTFSASKDATITPPPDNYAIFGWLVS